MKSRRPLSAFLLLFLLALSLACTGQQSPREASASIAPSRAFDYLSFIPEETNILFYANLQDLKNSPFGRDIRMQVEKKIREDDDDYLDFVEETGLDLEEDLYEVWISGEAGEERQNGGAIVRGNFDEDRIVDYIRKKNDRHTRKESYENVDLYIVEERGGEEFGYGFLDSKTMIIGKPFWLERVIDLSNNRGRSIEDNRDMLDHIRRIPRRPQLWGVFDVNELTDVWADELRNRGSGFAGTESLENMESMVIYVHVDRQAELFLEGSFGTAEQAELLAQTLNGFKAMAKLMVSDDREAIDMLNDIRIRSRGKVLKISAQIERDFFDKLEQKKKKFENRRFDFM